MNDARLRRLDERKRRENLRLSRRRDVRSGRPGRKLSVSGRRKSCEIGIVSVTVTVSVTANETPETVIGTEIETGIGIGTEIGFEIEIEIETGMIDTENTMTIQDPADILEMTGTAETIAETIAELAAGTLSRSQNSRRRRLSALSKRL